MSLMQSNEAAGREAQRAEGERSEAAGGGAAPQAARDPELKRPGRRHFSAEYKLEILKEADACEKPGETGALLRETDYLMVSNIALLVALATVAVILALRG